MYVFYSAESSVTLILEVGCAELANRIDRVVTNVRRDEAIKLLETHKPHLMREFGVVDLALFGSVARDAMGPNSDIDILVSFDGPATSRRYFGVLFYLEDLMGCPVDLVTEKALRAELRPYVEREAIHV